MRTLLACLCAIAGSGQLFSQPHSFAAPVAHSQQMSAPVFSRPLGGVQGAPTAGFSRPLGGVPYPTFPGALPPVKKQGMHSNSNLRYYGPVYYVPNAFDYTSSYYGSPYDQPVELPPPPPLPPMASYYEPAPEPAPAVTQEARIRPGDPMSEPQNYYLIEYKDHSIYSALAYWIEGDTLHYVTTQNTHNQASLSLIDLEKTAKLNEDRSVPFSIPGR